MTLKDANDILQERGPDGLREAFDIANVNNAPRQPFSKRASFTAAELQKVYFEPIPFVVEPILARGATLLASKPKKGKSWLALDLALAVACGAPSVCGDFTPICGDVLYFALEDNARRLQARLKKLAPPGDWPPRLTFRREPKLLGAGFAETVCAWAREAAQPALVIVDTFHFIRPPRPRLSYDGDYTDSSAVAKIAQECGAAIVVVHHLRKGASDDPGDTITGTLGIGAGFDSILTLTNNPAGGFDLEGCGRDLPEFRFAFDFDAATCRWVSNGDADQARIGDERRAILDALNRLGEAGPKELAEQTGAPPEAVRRLLGKMIAQGQVRKASYGSYTPGNTGHTGHTRGGGL